MSNAKKVKTFRSNIFLTTVIFNLHRRLRSSPPFLLPRHALYRFPDLNLIEQATIGRNLSSVADQELEDDAFLIGNTTTSYHTARGGLHPRGHDPGADDAKKHAPPSSPRAKLPLSPRQRRTEKWLYPREDQQFLFHIKDLVSLLDLPKRSGLAIEHPDFRMPEGQHPNQLEDAHKEDAKLRERYHAHKEDAKLRPVFRVLKVCFLKTYPQLEKSVGVVVVGDVGSVNRYRCCRDMSTAPLL